jgi:hypothetical protein
MDLNNREPTYIIKTITLGKDQDDFLKEYRLTHKFVLSKFIQTKLDEFIAFVKERDNEKRIE